MLLGIRSFVNSHPVGARYQQPGHGAGEGIRTPDPLITNQMLYQLSYASKTHPACRDKLETLTRRYVACKQTSPLTA